MYNDPSSSVYQSFPDFTLKPDITHFQRDQFNLRLLTDDSSLLWDSSKPSQLGIYDDGVSQTIKANEEQSEDLKKIKAKTENHSRNSVVVKEEKHKRITSQNRPKMATVDGHDKAIKSKQPVNASNGP